MRFVLALQNLVNSYNPKHCSTEMLIVYISIIVRVDARMGTYIRRGLSVVCSD